MSLAFLFSEPHASSLSASMHAPRTAIEVLGKLASEGDVRGTRLSFLAELDGQVPLLFVLPHACRTPMTDD